MKKLFLLAALVASTLTLTACGGGDDNAAMVAASDTTLAVDATTGTAVTAPFIGNTFAFSGGVPDFGTTADTTITLTEAPAGQTANPGFRIASGAQTANGVLEFGSCRFRVTSSTFTSGRLQEGAVITVQNCSFVVNTVGVVADNSQQTRSARWVLSTATSANVAVTLQINPGGQLTVNGRSCGTVTLTPVTGG